MVAIFQHISAILHAATVHGYKCKNKFLLTPPVHLLRADIFWCKHALTIEGSRDGMLSGPTQRDGVERTCVCQSAEHYSLCHPKNSNDDSSLGAEHLNPTEWDKEVEAVFTQRDGDRTFLIERIFVFGVISVLMGSALVVWAIPDIWFGSGILAADDQWFRGIWPKLARDAAVLDTASPLRGTKYALFVAYCVGVTFAVVTLMLPIVWRAIGKSSQRLTYPQSRALWIIPLALLFLIYWNGFETGFFGSDTSVARAITRGSVLWFWTALLWGASAMALAATAIVVAKLWTHGLPENNYEYYQRRGRELR